jgi:Mg2+ and Co2+ transporter CorA
MRKLLLSTLLLTAFFLVPGFALAQTPTPTVSPRGLQVKQEVKNRIATNSEERALALDERRRERIGAFFEIMVKRFEAAIARLEKLIERIENRIDKIKEETPSEDLTSQEEQLNDAKDKLEAAKDAISDMQDEFETFLTSDEPRVVFKELGKSIRDLKSDLVEIHRILVQIIGDLKGLRVGDEK